MKVEITGRHIVITPAIRTYTQKKLGKLAKLLGDDSSFHVIIEVAKERHTAEILLKSRLMELTGKGRSDDLYNSILLAIEKLEKQALKQKGKLIEGKRQKAMEKSVTRRTRVDEVVEDEPVPAPKKRKTASVREEALQKKPMTIEEAVLVLERAEYPFVAFRNSESGEMNVLYRRKTGVLRIIKG